MRVWIYLGIAACLGGMATVAPVAILSSRNAGVVKPANPEDVRVADGVLVSDYFGISYRVPDGWTEGLPGPNPSQSGYYVLGTWLPKDEFDATVLIVAQDMFFADDAASQAKSAVAEARRIMSSVDGMTIDREPEPASVGGHAGYRLDFSGVGLFRSMLAIEIRCHVVTFNLTSHDPESLASLVTSLDHLDTVAKSSDPAPECVKDYAADNTLRRIDPDPIGARAETIPVRVIVGPDGNVRHVHVIHASAAQRRNVEDAVRQWKFTPYLKGDHPVEVETGMMFNLKPASM